MSTKPASADGSGGPIPAMSVDAHVHLWRRSAGRYGWLDEPGLAAISRDWDMGDLDQTLGSHNVTHAVLVQAENSLADTRDMIAAAQRSRVSAVVAWAPLPDQAALTAALDEWDDYPLVVGVRHIDHSTSGPGWLRQPAVLDGLRHVRERGLSVDVTAATSEHLLDVAAMAERLPGLTVVVDHLGGPPLDGPARRPWAQALARVAELPNTVAKLSGLATLADPDLPAGGLAPCVEHAVSQFGVRRLMFGSDWPVCELAGGYDAATRLTAETTAGWTQEQREWLYWRTAANVYRLPSSVPAGAPVAAERSRDLA